MSCIFLLPLIGRGRGVIMSHIEGYEKNTYTAVSVGGLVGCD